MIQPQAVLADALDVLQATHRRVGRVVVYANMTYQVDTTAAAGAKMAGQARAANAYLDPELLAIGQETLRRWIVKEPRLAYLGHCTPPASLARTRWRGASLVERRARSRRTSVS